MSDAPSLPTPISPENAKLPAAYEQARMALAACENLDELQTWADKSAALASYARMARDDELLAMARRVQARAAQRMGELFNEIQPATGQNLRQERRPTPPFGREQAARDAGVSQDQRKRAQRIAEMAGTDPQAFDQVVEGPAPPTLGELDRQARGASASSPRARAPKDGRREEPSNPTQTLGELESHRATPPTARRRPEPGPPARAPAGAIDQLERLARSVRVLAMMDASRVAGTLPPGDRPRIRRAVEDLQRWCTTFLEASKHTTGKSGPACPRCDDAGCDWCRRSAPADDGGRA